MCVCVNNTAIHDSTVVPYNSHVVEATDRIDRAEQFREAYWLALREVDSLRLQQWERIGLTLPQLRVLFQVRRTPGVTTGELAKGMGISVSTTSGLVIKLEGLGLIERMRAPGDRRREPLGLTAAGIDVAGEITDITHPIFDAVAERLGADLPVVIAMLEHLHELIAEVPRGARPASTGCAPVGRNGTPRRGGHQELEVIMPLSLRSLSVLAFAMFAMMWLGAISQSPGGMSTFAHEIAAVEQELLPPPQQPHVQTGDQPRFDVYPGGVVCEETTNAAGEPETTNCQAPLSFFPY